MSEDCRRCRRYARLHARIGGKQKVAARKSVRGRNEAARPVSYIEPAHAGQIRRSTESNEPRPTSGKFTAALRVKGGSTNASLSHRRPRVAADDLGSCSFIVTEASQFDGQSPQRITAVLAALASEARSSWRHRAWRSAPGKTKDPAGPLAPHCTGAYAFQRNWRRTI